MSEPTPPTEIPPASLPATDPVLAGFARLAAPPLPPPAEPDPIDPSLSPWQAGLVRLARQRAAQVDSPAPPPLPPEPQSRLRSPRLWICILSGTLALLLVVGSILYLRANSSATKPTGPNPAAIAIANYAHLCNSEIVEPLRRNNDGTLTGEQALKLIETARPVIQRHTWHDIAQRLTNLQDADGKLHQADTAAFLDELSTGLLSF